MKLSKIICINLLLISTNFYSQEFDKSKKPDSTTVEITKYGIGVKAGFNFATISRGNLSQPPDARSSFYFGFNYEIPIIEQVFSVQPELIYTRQGFEKRYVTPDNRHTSIYKVDYISIPLVARYYVVRGFSLEAGPQVSFKIGEKFDRDQTDLEPINPDDVNNFDYGFILGLSFEFESGFFVNGRYNRSFNEIIDGLNAKNTVIQLGVGYKF